MGNNTMQTYPAALKALQAPGPVFLRKMPLFNCFLPCIHSKLTIDLNLRALCPSSTHLQLPDEITMRRLNSPVLFCFPAFLVLQSFQPSSAQYTATFQYPTGGEVYNVLDTVVVQWTSNYASTTLFTWIWDVTSDDGQEGALQISYLAHYCTPYT
jgi:hypothetical protein